MTRRLHGFRCSSFTDPNDGPWSHDYVRSSGGIDVSAPPSKPRHCALFHCRGRENWHSARFFRLRLLHRPFIPQLSAPSCSYNYIRAGGLCHLSPSYPKPRPSARFHGRSRENVHLARFSAPQLFRVRFFHHPKAPTRPHGHIRTVGPSRLSRTHSKPCPSARFHGRGPKNGHLTRFPARKVLRPPLRACASALAITPSHMSSTASLKVDC